MTGVQTCALPICETTSTKCSLMYTARATPRLAVRVEPNLPRISAVCAIFCVYQMHDKKMFYLKNEGQGHRVYKSQRSIRWQILTSVKVILEHIWLALIFFKIFTFQISWPCKFRSKSWCTSFAVTPSDGNYLGFYLMAIVMVEFFQLILVKTF